MSEKERETIIAQLAFAEGVNEAVFVSYSDEQLLQRIDKLYGQDKEG